MVFVINTGQVEKDEAGRLEQENQKLARIGMQCRRGDEFIQNTSREPLRAGGFPGLSRLHGDEPDQLPRTHLPLLVFSPHQELPSSP